MSPPITVALIAAACGVPLRTVQRWVQRPDWPQGEKRGQAGEYVWALEALPRVLKKQRGCDVVIRDAVRSHLMNQAVTGALSDSSSLVVATPPVISAAGASVPAVFSAQVPARLPDTYHHEKTAKQRVEESARKAVMAHLERLRVQTGCSQEAAITTMLVMARKGDAIGETLKLARDGRGRRSEDGLPSRRGIKCWLGKAAHGLDLAPAVRQPDFDLKPWHGLCIQLKQRPQGGTVRWIADQIREKWNPAWGAAPPSYDAIARFLRDKASKFDVLVGRHTGMDLKSQMPYQPRTREGLWPAMEVHADGWNTHFTAPHPVTGEYVTLEVWTAMDFATGYPTTPAVGLRESYEVIAKCLENFVRELGVPVVFQTDNTGSVKNDRFEFDGIASLQSRLGFTIAHPALVATGKGNSQANGMVESLHAWYDRESRELATYQAKGQDSLTLKRVKRITAKAAKETDPLVRANLLTMASKEGKGLVFASFQQAVDWINAKVDKRRNTPNRGLPMTTDPVTGKRRHMTPRERLAQYVEQGWEPVSLTQAELIDAFRPHIRKTVRRGMVSPYGGQLYSHPDLIHYNGEEVMVAVDIMDAYRCWVKTLEGRLICEAAYVQGKLPRPRSLYQDGEEKRADAQIKRRENQIDAIEARVGGAALEAPSSADILPFGPITLEGEARREEEPAALTLEELYRPEPRQEEESVIPAGMDFATWIAQGAAKDSGEEEPPKEAARR